jgi:hypothetical protein
MATRSLTDVYFLMRNNAIANKNVFQDNSVSVNEYTFCVYLL